MEAISEGTKDQVATLFRLGIAEQLGSLIVLDDHLNQSDPHRVSWFLEHLRETGQRIQVVLITCRPNDYLRQDETSPFRDLEHGRGRAVDLGRLVSRY